MNHDSFQIIKKGIKYTEEGPLPVSFIFFFMPFQTVLAGAYFLCHTEARQFIIRKACASSFLILLRRTTATLATAAMRGAFNPPGPKIQTTEARPPMLIESNIPETRPQISIECDVSESPASVPAPETMPPISTEAKPFVSIVRKIPQYKSSVSSGSSSCDPMPPVSIE